jgi:hypothetical protein
LVLQGLQKWLQTPETQQLEPHPSPLLAQTWPQAPQFFQSLVVSVQAAVVPPAPLAPPAEVPAVPAKPPEP